MLRSTIAAAAVLAAAALLARSGSAEPQAAPLLTGKVGPGFTIDLRRNGSRVTRLTPGTYRLVVSDRSAIHNFVVERSRGGAFERTVTAVPFVGTKTVTVTLRAGTWEFYCHPHQRTMKGKFVVAPAGAAPAPAPEPGDDNGGATSGGSDDGSSSGKGGIDY